jgi:hypothetical protein
LKSDLASGLARLGGLIKEMYRYQWGGYWLGSNKYWLLYVEKLGNNGAWISEWSLHEISSYFFDERTTVAKH